MMKVIRVKLRAIVDLICFIGCSMQIYQITCIYFKFKVNHEVTYDYNEQVVLPSIDIIIPMVMAINLTELFIRYPEQMANLCRKVYLNKEVNYTIDNFYSQCSDGVKKAALLSSINIAPFIKVKDIHELTIDPREMIEFVQIVHSGLITDQCNFTRYYNGFAVLLRISCTEQASLIADNMNIVGSYDGFMAAVSHSLGSYFGIRFTSHHDIPVYQVSRYFMVRQQSDIKLSLAWVRYGKIVSRSLPYPYETNCRFYNKYKFLSKCITNHSLHLGFLMRNFVNEWDSQPEHLGFTEPSSDDEYEYEYEEEGDDNEDEEERESELNLVKSNCAEQTFVPECEKTVYTIEGEINSEKFNYNSDGLVLIEQPITPIMYFNANPNLLMSEYLIFVGSIIGTWFGFSIFDRLISSSTWIESKVNAKIRKNRESKRPIKLFTIRNSYYFTDSLRKSTSY